MNKIEERTIKFLKKISKLCEDESRDIIKKTKFEIETNETIDSLVLSSQIMSVAIYCRGIIIKMRSKKDD